MKTKLLVLSALVAAAFSGCAGASFAGQAPGAASLYADVSGTTEMTHVDNLPANHSYKSAEACQTSILGLITTGSTQIGETAKAGNITRVNRVDYKFSNLLGLYAKYCVVVIGD